VKGSRQRFWIGYAAAALFVALAVALLKLTPGLTDAAQALLLLVVVFLVAWRWESGPGVLAAVLATLAFNFFFLPPLYTLTIQDPRNVVALAVFLMAALVIGHLSALSRLRLRQVETERQELSAVTQLSQAFLADTNRESLLGTAAERLGRALECRQVTVLLGDDLGQLSIGARTGSENVRQDLAELAFRQGNSASFPSAASGSDLYLPVSIGVHRVGVLVAQGAARSERMAEICATLLGLALERERFLKVAREAEGTRTRDEMKSTLLATLAHDIKTPLAAALGSVENWISESGPTREAELARESLERLSRLVNDLIAVVRLESGAMAPNRELVSVEEIAEAALSRFGESLGGHNLYVDVASPDCRVLVDPAQITEALGLGLENAARYSPAGTGIRLTGAEHGGEAIFSVVDEGPSIPAADRERVFAKFVRLPGAESTPGTGLGLYIARNLVELNGGSLALSSPEKGGTRFEIRLPVGAA
jgi:two-component system, OmpR family, sensor histidine kinase KdpD